MQTVERPKTEIRKIRRIFDKIGCPAIVILQTPRDGEEVDNGCGLEFELPEWAIINEGNYYDSPNRGKLYDFERKHNIGMMHFDKDRCSSVDGMIAALYDHDAYEVVWRRN